MPAIIPCVSTFAPEHLWLLSVSFWPTSLEVLREASWWFWATPSSSCSVGYIYISTCLYM